MAFSIDSSTVNLAARRLEVIGNNVSNANTTGYKGSEFDQILASATAADGAGGSSGGRQSFSQGKIAKTINPLDIAISGTGFFRVVNPSGEVSYTRSGRFVLNLDGEIVNAVGGQLTGYMADDAGKIQTTGGPIPLQIDRPIDPPKITETAHLRLTLDSRQVAPDATVPFNITVPESYNHFTSTSVYDAQGKELSMQTYYVKDSAAANTWNLYAGVTGSGTNATTTVSSTPVGSIQFDENGKLLKVIDTKNGTTWNAGDTKDPVIQTTIPGTGTGTGTGTEVTDSPLNIDFTDSVQYGTTFNVRSSQDGRALGTMDDYTVTAEGLVTARYSNGYSATLGKVVLASFQNLNGLKAISQNEWIETLDSGTPSLGDPGVGAMGSLEASSIEEANIDLTEEMIKMIAAQRNFQVAAEMIKKQDEVTQTVANIGN